MNPYSIAGKVRHDVQFTLISIINHPSCLQGRILWVAAMINLKAEHERRLQQMGQCLVGKGPSELH